MTQQHSDQTRGRGWLEQYAGGSPEAERAEFEQLATGIMEAQAKAQKKASRHGVPHGAERGRCTPSRPSPSTTPS